MSKKMFKKESKKTPKKESKKVQKATKNVSSMKKKAEASISKKRKRGNPNRTTGLIGVVNSGKKYMAQIRYGGTPHYLGRFDTKEQAGIAYDRFVVDKSTEEFIYALNYPKMSDREREEALKAGRRQNPYVVRRWQCV